MICPVCRNVIARGFVCSVCGHDESRNYETHLTLCPVPAGTKSIQEKRKEYEDSRLDDRISLLLEKRMTAYQGQIANMEKRLSSVLKQSGYLAEIAENAVLTGGQQNPGENAEARSAIRQENVSGRNLQERISSPAFAATEQDLQERLFSEASGEVRQNPYPFPEVPESGSMVRFGHYMTGRNGEIGPVLWKILTINDLVTGTDKSTSPCALLVSEYGLDVKCFHEKLQTVQWADSSLKHWLNSEFMNTSFTQEQRAAIVPVDRHLRMFGSPGSRELDYVFLLDRSEVNSYLPSAQSRQTKPTEYARKIGLGIHDEGPCGRWWLRDPGSRPNLARKINAKGKFDADSNVNEKGIMVKPAVWVTIDGLKAYHD